MFGMKQQKEQYETMIASITNQVYQEVGKRIEEQTQKQQEDINKQLIQRLEDWDKMIQTRVEEIVKGLMKNDKTN